METETGDTAGRGAVGGGGEIFERQGREAAEPGGMRAHGGGQLIVDLAGESEQAAGASSALSPIPPMETTWKSMSASSIAAMRPAPTSSSLCSSSTG